MTDTRPFLVTGATGFLGAALVRRLVAEGHAVRILRREASQLAALGGVVVEEVVGDITDAAAVARAVAGCRAVFHCAALIEYWDARNQEQDAINIGGTRHVVAACLQHGVARLVHVSSIAAIGLRADGVPADETTPYNLHPLRLNYADSKYGAELEVRAGIARGLDAVTVNPGTIYGPGDHRHVRYIQGLAGPVTAAGGMSVVDVDDVVEGTIRAWRNGRGGERYILVAERLTFQEVGRRFARALGRHGPRWTLPPWLVRVVARLATWLCTLFGRRPVLTPTMARAAATRFYYTGEKATRELGLVYRPFDETVARTVAWMQQRN